MPLNASPGNDFSRASTLPVNASQSIDLDVLPLDRQETTGNSAPKAGANTLDDAPVAAETSA